MLPHHDVTLANGLQVVLVPQPAVHRAVASLFLRVGSRFETEETNGISHFLEHMVFRGTPSLPTAHDQALAFERLGGTLYAATHVDHGLMSVAVPPQNLGPVLALLGEVTRAPRFGEIEVERGIVREEILEDLDDEGRDVDPDNLTRELIYDKHPLGYTITGGLATLARFDEALLRAHHARHYTAENAVLCIAGRLDAGLGGEGSVARSIERTAGWVEEHFGALPRGARVPVSPPGAEQNRARFRFVENQSSQTDLRIAFRAPCERDAMEPAVEMLLRVIDDGMSTRLYERICDRLGLCYDVSAMYEVFEDDGVVDVAAGTTHERSTQVAKEILSLFADLAEHGPTDGEIDKARNRHAWSIEAMEDDADGVAGFYGLAALAGIARSPAARHGELAAVTRDQIRDAARHVFRAEKMSAIAVGLLSRSEESRLEKAVRAFA